MITKKEKALLQDIIYLDNAATEPMSPVAFSSLKECYEHPELYQGNPNSSHLLGSAASAQLLKYKNNILSVGFPKMKDLIMTSGSTESINLFFANIYHYYSDQFRLLNTIDSEVTNKCLFIYSDADHKAVKNTIKKLVSLSPVEFVEKTFTLKQQVESPIKLFELLTNTIKEVNPSVVVMNVTTINNETGSIFPLDIIVSLRNWCKENNIELIIHGDNTQAFLKTPFATTNDFDAVSISGHKFGALKGIGLLAYNEKVQNILKFNADNNHSFITGGGQQGNIRSGTQNPVAVKMISDLIDDFHNRIMLSQLSNHAPLWTSEKFDKVFLTIKEICSEQGLEAKLNETENSPYIMSLCIKGLEAESFMAEISEDFAVSAGSACNSETLEPSYVLQSMGIPLTEQNCTTRWSFSNDTNVDVVVEKLKEVLPQHIKRLKGVSIPYDLMQQLDDGTCDINHEEIED